MDGLGARLKDLSARRRVSEDEIARQLGVTRRALNYYLNDERRPPYETLAHLAQLFDVSLDYLITGSHMAPAPGGPRLPESRAGDFALIPLHEAELSAGAGSEGGDAVEGMVAFRRDWLARLGVPERTARLARIRGDSMEPLLRGGDVVLIDTARTTVPARSPAGLARIRRNPELALYAVRRGPDLFVKRVERTDWKGVVLLSENWAGNPPEFVPEAEFESGHAAILGQVRWWAHSVER